MKIWEVLQELAGRNKFFVPFVFAIIYAIILLTIATPEIFSLMKEYSVIIAGALSLVAIGIALSGILSKKAEVNMKLNEYEKLKSGETHPVLYHQILKDVSILDDKGNALVSYKMTCKNTCENNIIPQLIHKIDHDGTIEEYSATINEKKAKTVFEKFIKEKIENGKRVTPKLSHILKIKFDLSEENIKPGERFLYGYTVKYKGVYSNMFKKHEEFCGQNILHPTKSLLMLLHAPKGLRFLREEMDIEVLDKHEVRDTREERRCWEIHPPQLSHNDIEILWELQEPKIACTYKLYFTVSKT